MRVVQLLPAMHVGGVERGVVELSRALSANAIDSVVISRPGELCAEITNSGGKHYAFDCGSKNIFSVPARVYRLQKLLNTIAPDIVHVRSRVPAWLLAFVRQRFKVISTFHGIYSVSRYSAQMTHAEAIICPSQAVRQHILQHYSVAAERLHLIHRGVDLHYFDPTAVQEEISAGLRQRLQLAERTVFAIVGRGSGLKGHALFLQAFARLCNNSNFSKPPLALLVGDFSAKHKQRIQQLAQSLQLAPALRFAGVVRDMREIYQCSDVVVSASTQPEAFGRTVAEAIAMQRAAVAPAHGGALDIIRTGENGILFTPGDAEALAAAMQQATTLPRNALRQSVQQFSLARMATQTQTLYQQLMAQSH